MTASQGFHEPAELLSEETKDKHRAIVSLQEELEAIDWYSQRIDAAQDPELREVLRHNRDEEIEHAAMVLEWLRRRDPVFDRELSQILFTSAPLGSDAQSDEPPAAPSGGSLGIGSLKSARGAQGEEK